MFIVNVAALAFLLLAIFYTLFTRANDHCLQVKRNGTRSSPEPCIRIY